MAEASPTDAARLGMLPHPPTPPPSAQLPVVDLVGLRFSLQHLRLVGYGLLAVWLSEIANLLTSPKLAEIGTRLHYTSQFLDLSPILLVAIGLIAYQGGLRRRPLEAALLPLLLALLPLLSAFHFFLAPVSVANAITLVQKQQQIGLDQIEKIDQQIDRASTILRESDSIDTLLEGLQRIPGLQVRVPPRASVSEARQEVRRSLERERDRLRDRIEGNLTASREAFLRRAITNALLALLVGLLLWGLHHGAMREMEQAIPFLDWVLVQGDSEQQAESLQELLRFQRACVALGWFSLLERSLRLVRRVVRRPTAEQLLEEERNRQRQAQSQAQAPRSRFDQPHPPSTGLVSSPPPLTSGRHPSLFPVADLEIPPLPEAAEAPEPDPLAERMQRISAASQRVEDRRRQRDLERYRALRRRIEREGSDPFAIFAPEDPEQPPSADPGGAPPPEALSSMGRAAEPTERRPADVDPQQDRQGDLSWSQERSQPPPAARSPRRGLSGLWHWFLTHI